MAQRSQCIPLILLKAGHPKGVESRLIVTLATYNEESYSRAVLKINGEAGRIFGTRHREAHESAQNLLSSLPQPYRISNAEKIRVLGLVESPTPPSSQTSLQSWSGRPRSPREGPTPPSGHGSQPRSPRGGAIIHQMYGLFKDNKAMPTLFEDSMQRWRQVARNMGAKYHLWNADEVDALIKQGMSGCGKHIVTHFSH